MTKRPTFSDNIDRPTVFVCIAIAAFLVMPVDAWSQTNEANSPQLQQQVIDEIMSIREQLGGGLSQSFEGLSDQFDSKLEFGNSLRQQLQNPPSKGDSVPIPKGKRVIAIKIAKAKLPAGIRPGESVDVVLASRKPLGKSGSLQASGDVVNESMFRAQVFSVDPRAGDPLVVGLLVSSDQADQIILARNSGEFSIRTPVSQVSSIPPIISNPFDPAPSIATSPDKQAALDRSQVKLLRLTARRMDELAANLEDLDVIQQADELRDLAQRFRLRARAANGGHSSVTQKPGVSGRLK